MRKKYYIENIGCDDTTYSTLELTNEELKVLLVFANTNNLTSGGCKPTILIYDEDINYFNRDTRKSLTKEQEC